jgi:hypothetical protein
VIVVWEYSGCSGLYFRERERAYFWGIESCLVSRVLEVLSSVESSVNGPQSGSDHRHCGSKDSHYDCRQRMRRARKEYPDANDGNRDSGEWRPQANKEKYARNRRDQIGEGRR